MNAHETLTGSFADKHPDRVAQLVETAPTNDLAEFLGMLGSKVAARVLGYMVPTAGAQALMHMDARPASAIVRELHPGLAAALLRRIDDASAAALLGELPPKLAEPIARVRSYRDDQVASRADPRAPAVGEQSMVNHALEVVRQAADSALHYVYVIDTAHKLVGACSMRELMCAAETSPVSDVMVKAPHRLLASDPLDSVVVHPGWRRVHALPVVDDAGRFVGVIRYSQFRQLETAAGKSRSSGSSTATSAALGQLFWLGASAMLHLGEAAVLGRERVGGDT